ncbi:MAG: bi-domain-containing oxidoreductase [Blastocatellia bacterium]|nr:bi-domain-containing oxidoreductase [Blastocatellia bacterium]
MKQIVQNFRTGDLLVEELPPPALKPGGVLVHTAYSLISAGTERTTVSTGQSSLIGKALKRPDLVKQVWQTFRREGFRSTFEKVTARLDTTKALGYSSAGVVLEVGDGVDEFRPGDLVACAGVGYASHAEVNFVPRNLCVPIPSGVGMDAAAFTTLGAIAMQGVRQARVELGSCVLVIGLGLLGQLTIQILRAAGCRTFGIDVDPGVLALAKESGVDEACARNEDSLKARFETFSRGRGADAVIITASTDKADPVELAGELARDRGRVVVVGAVKMDIPREHYFRKELDLCVSRSYGPGRYDPLYEEGGIDYPIGFVRWTERRNMEEFLRLVSLGLVKTDFLTSHRFTVERAQEAYDVILGKTKERPCGVLIQYPQAPAGEAPKRKLLLASTAARPKPGTVGVGFVGAGNFATATLLPPLKELSNVNLTGVVTSTGLSGKNTAKRFKFEYCSSDFRDLLTDGKTNAVFVATRHNLHAAVTLEVLNARAAVFVEKPLCLSEEELREIAAAHTAHDQVLMVGFNRRFSPLAQALKQRIGKRGGPACINYRINAGFIPKDSWIQDPNEGGGRILGEVCHFVDMIQFLTDAEPVRVFAETVSSGSEKQTDADTIQIILKMSDGSVGQITYLAVGDTSFPKERLEYFGDKTVGVIDDYKTGSFTRDGKTETLKGGAQDKGHRTEIQAFIKAVAEGKESPIPFRSIALTTLTTLKIVESYSTGMPVRVDLNGIL